MTSLAVVIVSTDDADWLRRCLPTLFAHAGGLTLDVAVVDNSASGEATDLVNAQFPEVRVLRCANHGFSHGSNCGFASTTAPYVLFLNPDTEAVEGSLADLVRYLDDRPEVGVAGVRQLTADGRLYPTIRRFPTPTRLLMQALVTERATPWSLGLRVLDPVAYERETPCDWISGSFMLARREVLAAVGVLDERFFLYNEEMDLCLRVKRGGWQVMYVPTMTIVHHAGKAGYDERLAAQSGFAWQHYLAKNCTRRERVASTAALSLNFGLRAIARGPGSDDEARRVAARAALQALLGIRPPPFGPPPARALAATRDPSPPRAP